MHQRVPPSAGSVGDAAYLLLQMQLLCNSGVSLDTQGYSTRERQGCAGPRWKVVFEALDAAHSAATAMIDESRAMEHVHNDDVFAFVRAADDQRKDQRRSLGIPNSLRAYDTKEN